MNAFDLCTLIKQNLIKNQSIIKKIIFSLTIIFVLLECSLVIYISYCKYKNDFNNSNKQDCYYYKDITRFSDVANLDITNISDTVTLLNIKNIDCKDLMYKDLKITINSKSYIFQSEFEENSKSQEINANIVGTTELDFASYKPTYCIFPSFVDARIIGRFPTSCGQIMVDTNFLYAFGIDKSKFNDIIGTKISLKGNDTFFLTDYTIVGVFDSTVLQARESRYAPDLHLEHMYINPKKQDLNSFVLQYGSERYYFDNYMHFLSYDDYINKFLESKSTSLSTKNDMKITPRGMEFCLTVFLLQNIGKLFFIIVIVLMVIIVLSVYCLVHIYIESKRKYHKMLIYIGMNSKDYYMLHWGEILCVILTALLLGSYISLIILKILNYLLTLTVHFSLCI